MSGPKTTINVCVLRDEQAADRDDGWSVVLCVENTPRQVLGRFGSRPEALSFALRERRARDVDNGLELRVVCPDHCPCYVDAGPSPRDCHLAAGAAR